MVVSSVGNANAFFHAEKLALSLGQEIVTFWRESIVWINLENQAGFSIVSKQGMSVDLRLVVSSSMPALTIENQHTTRFCSHLKNMLNRKSFWWTGHSTLVTAWNNSC